MKYPNLENFVEKHTPKLVENRKKYLNNLKGFIATNPSNSDEENIARYNWSDEFAWTDKYRCWVDYSPYFFRELFDVYTDLIERGYTEEKLSPFIENKIRILKYFPQILLPGAYLDKTIPDKTKMEFLDKFSKTSENVVTTKGYSNLDLGFLSREKKSSENEKQSVGRLIALLGETCEYIYFGDQEVGFPSFGIDHFIIPEKYVLYQDFDLNAGTKTILPSGRINTITVYPRYPSGVVPRIFMDNHDAHIFINKPIDEDPLRGRPSLDYLEKGYASINHTPLSAEEIESIEEELCNHVLSDSKNRTGENRINLLLDYSSIQSRVIKNLHNLRGSEWRLPQDAENSIRDNSLMKELKEELGLNYNMEVSVKLIEDAISWCKT